MTQNLHRYDCLVHHSSHDRGEFIAVAASSPLTARIIAAEKIRQRHNFPTSVTLFAEVVR